MDALVTCHRHTARRQPAGPQTQLPSPCRAGFVDFISNLSIYTVCILQEVIDSIHFKGSRLLYLPAKRSQAAWLRGPGWLGCAEPYLLLLNTEQDYFKFHFYIKHNNFAVFGFLRALGHCNLFHFSDAAPPPHP